MAKQSRSKKTKKTSRSSQSTRITYYLKVYFVAVLVGAVVFFAGKYLFPSKPPCANSLTCKTDLTVKIENGATGIFQGHTVIAPKINLAFDATKPAVLGDNVPSSEKHIYVDLASQTLYAYEGNTKIMQTFISSGRWNKTPVGNFHIWEKLRSTRMAGGEGADAYNLPNVPYVMYFYNDFGLHGAYWHDNFGHTMSHGCVNMRQVDAGTLYNWADGPADGHLGTAVSICDQFTAPNTCIQNNPIN